MKKIILAAALLFGCAKAQAPGGLPEDFQCHTAVVEWLDATQHTRSASLDGDWHKLLTHQVSIGCVAEQGDVLVVVQNVSQNAGADIFIALPSKWVTRITPLEEKPVVQ